MANNPLAEAKAAIDRSMNPPARECIVGVGNGNGLDIYRYRPEPEAPCMAPRNNPGAIDNLLGKSNGYVRLGRDGR